jgi:hypothetical protein
MCDPTEPFDFPDLPDEAVIAIDAFLEEFCVRFQNHYFAQIHRHYHERPDAVCDLEQMMLPLPDPPF